MLLQIDNVYVCQWGGCVSMGRVYMCVKNVWMCGKGESVHVC